MPRYPLVKVQASSHTSSGRTLRYQSVAWVSLDPKGIPAPTPSGYPALFPSKTAAAKVRGRKAVYEAVVALWLAVKPQKPQKPARPRKR